SVSINHQRALIQYLRLNQAEKPPRAWIRDRFPVNSGRAWRPASLAAEESCCMNSSPSPPPPAEANRSGPTVALRIISGPHQGEQFVFDSHNTLVVGRATDAQWPVAK